MMRVSSSARSRRRSSASTTPSSPNGGEGRPMGRSRGGVTGGDPRTATDEWQGEGTGGGTADDDPATSHSKLRPVGGVGGRVHTCAFCLDRGTGRGVGCRGSGLRGGRDWQRHRPWGVGAVSGGVFGRVPPPDAPSPSLLCVANFHQKTKYKNNKITHCRRNSATPSLPNARPGSARATSTPK